MKGSIIWKVVLTAVVVSWAILNLIPLQDTPFETHIETRASANAGEFQLLLEQARERIAEGQETTLFLALRNLAEEEQIDLHGRFFPDINLVDVVNLNRRNEILMRVLLEESQGRLKRGLDLQGGVSFTLRINDQAETDRQAELWLEDAIRIMSDRVNGLGVAEPLIRAVPPNAIEIQLPGLNLEDNPEAADALRRPARLEFREVYRFDEPRADELDGAIRSLQVDPRETGSPMAAYEVMTMEEEDRETRQMRETRYYVRVIPEATGEIINQAWPFLSETSQWWLSIEMTSDGARVFGDVTRKMHEQDQRGPKTLLATVLDGKLYSAFGLREGSGPITGGRAQITGQFSQREAAELANVLNNPLEFELLLEEMYEVGPSLAQDARIASINAAKWGAALVIVFMIAYYGVAGLVAVISVVLNLIIVLGVLASLGATLTLPGVAALVLTIGMAVDANILIFERIREELRIGKSLKSAIQAGYDKAFSTIVDANVTTMITALILIFLGREAVKGFGVTLAVGIGSSVFCALIVSRFLLELVTTTKLQKLLPFDLLRQTAIPFLNHRKPAFIAAWIVVMVGVWAIATHGRTLLGIDFRGGASVTLAFNQEVRGQIDIGQILMVGQREDLGELQAVYQKLIGGTEERLNLQMDSQEGRVEAVVGALQSAFPEAEFRELSRSVIGAAVSKEVQMNAIYSVLIALIGILLYVALRFEFGYGVGAVVATVHDVLMSIGIFVILGQIFGIGSGQFTGPMVAAVLMIVGYSINDTIVTFDRIREELELNPEKSLFDVINLGINRTLGRTLLTSFTTFVAATTLFIFGEGIVSDFALVFMIGILTGTFSSIFIASPVFFWWHKGDRKHVLERELTRPDYAWESTSQRSRRPAKPAP